MTLWILLVGVHVGALVWWLMTPKDSGFWKLPIEEQARCCIEAGMEATECARLLSRSRFRDYWGQTILFPGEELRRDALNTEIRRQKQESGRRAASAMQKLARPLKSCNLARYEYIVNGRKFNSMSEAKAFVALSGACVIMGRKKR